MKLVGIIPTLNRHNDIRRLFDSIAQITPSTEISFSILLVDNSGDGNLKNLVDTIECPFELSYINQKKKGLSNARNAAIDAIAVNTDYICTIDDDLVLPESFLINLLTSIQQYPNAGMIGGRVELFNDQDLPITIKTSKEHEKYTGGLNLFGFVHGCCMLFSKDVMDTIGKFDTYLGAGSKCGSAEDTDYYYRIWLSGKDIIYCPDWFVYHNHGRRSEDARITLKRNYLIGQGAFLVKYLISFEFNAIKMIYWDLSHDVKSYFNKDNNEAPTDGSIYKWKKRIYGGYNYLKSQLRGKKK
ncbi:glycosyltransferase family 2 protein [Paraglaciecola marina]|uniref:glycosyltransferase family 2 protein n=1 Tax=Paraglaciecola marina TaxID=2500157 RepID=UPI00105D41A6|nr:glycosyltransferase [Paraglaciecola marina]